MNKKFKLINATERSRVSDRFQIPNDTEISKIKRGDFVKIGAIPEDGIGGERFWVKVDYIVGSILLGKVANNLITIDINYNDDIEFSKNNIMEICK